MIRWFVLLCYGNICYAQQSSNIFSPIAYSKNHNLSLVAVDHPASLMSLASFEVNLQTTREYMLPELGIHSLAFTLPTHSGTFAAKHSLLSHNIYKNSVTIVSYGMKLSERMTAGAMFELLHTNIIGYGKTTKFTGGMGTMITLHSQLVGSVQVKNINNDAFSRGSEVPMIYQFGIGYDVAKETFIGMEISMSANQDATIDLTLSYAPHPRVTLIGAVNLKPATPKFGVLIPLKIGSVCVHSSFHPQLGVSPGILLLYRRSKLK